MRRRPLLRRGLLIAAGALGAACLLAVAAVAIGLASGWQRVHTSPRPLGDHRPDYYGFVGVECGLAGPGEDLLAEVAPFTNLAHVCVFDLDIRAELRRVHDHHVRALVDLTTLLFDSRPGTTPRGDGPDWFLRPDADRLWRDFLDTNRQLLDPEHVAGFYLVDEPVWNGIPAGDVEHAAALLERDLPDLPSLVVEAPDVLDRAVFPSSVDWIGFDHFATGDPYADHDYLDELALLRDRLRPGQRIALIMDASWLPAYRWVGLSREDLGPIARSYQALASDSPDVVALIGYSWPGSIEPGEAGARDLPAPVRRVYRDIGAWVASASQVPPG